jgi:hypothetical protein
MSERIPKKIAEAVAKYGIFLLGSVIAAHAGTEALNYLDQPRPDNITAVERAGSEANAADFLIDLGEIAVGGVLQIGSGIVILSGFLGEKKRISGDIAPDSEVSSIAQPVPEV